MKRLYGLHNTVELES